MAGVFVSYASEDLALAGEVHRWLVDAGHQVFLDQDPRDGIALGEPWRQRLQLVAVGRDVVWKISEKVAVDLTRRQGQHVIAQMVDILAAFRGPRDREVVPLYHPKPGVAVDPELRGGYPMIAGTRVPYDMVASLLEDGITAEEVAGFYPAVSVTAARGALAFARYVEGYREPVSA